MCTARHEKDVERDDERAPVDPGKGALEDDSVSFSWPLSSFSAMSSPSLSHPFAKLMRRRADVAKLMKPLYLLLDSPSSVNASIHALAPLGLPGDRPATRLLLRGPKPNLWM
jgi:hypothetical protein